MKWLSSRHLLLCCVLAAGVGCGQASSEQAAEATTAPATTSFAPPTSTPPPTPRSKVPAVKGKDLNSAKKTVRAAGFTVQVVFEYTDEIAAGQVIDQAPAPHVVADEGDVVRLSVARPLPRIPNVLGKTLDQARRMLKHAGFDVGKVSKQASSQTKHTVISQSPPAGTGAQPGRNVNLVIAKPEPPPTSNCTSGYSPCLVYHGGADYDCAGGSGGGPYYTDPGVVYQVTGSDPYGLDANNNGLGCE